MTKRILVVIGHPDPNPDRFVRALAERYAAAARSAGARVDVVDLARMEIPFLRTAEEFEHADVPSVLAASVDSVRAATHYVILFPLWLGGMPAMLKAFLEQAFRPGVAFRHRENGRPEKLMKGRSARVVVTMGMPAVVYRLFYLSHGVKMLERNILNFVGIDPVRTTYCGGVAGASEAKRAAWLEAMDRAGERGD
jgi:putative NADPH-quinone reductase